MGEGTKFEDFQKFAESNFRDLKCEVCSHDEWMFKSEQKVVPYKISTDIVHSDNVSGIPINTKFEIGLVVVSCENCGNTKFFDIKTMRNWLERNNAS